MRATVISSPLLSSPLLSSPLSPHLVVHHRSAALSALPCLSLLRLLPFACPSSTGGCAALPSTDWRVAEAAPSGFPGAPPPIIAEDVEQLRLR